MSIILVSLLKIDFFQFCGQIIRVVETGLILTRGVSVVTLQSRHSPPYGCTSSEEVLNVQIIIVRKTDWPGNFKICYVLSGELSCLIWGNLLKSTGRSKVRRAMSYLITPSPRRM